MGRGPGEGWFSQEPHQARPSVFSSPVTPANAPPHPAARRPKPRVNTYNAVRIPERRCLIPVRIPELCAGITSFSPLYSRSCTTPAALSTWHGACNIGRRSQRQTGTPARRPASRPMPKTKEDTHDRPRLAHPLRHPGEPPAPVAVLNHDKAGPAPRHRRPAFLQYTDARPCHRRRTQRPDPR